MNVNNGMISLTLSNQVLERAVESLRSVQSRFPLAVARAANRTMYGMGTDAAHETAQRYFVKVGDVKKTLEYRKATTANMIGTMISRGKRHSLGSYKISPTVPKFKRDANGRLIQTPVKGAVKREGGVKSLGPAFLVKRGSGKYFPYYRTGQGRWKFSAIISPSIPQIVKNDETVQAMERKAEERFSKRIEHEVLHILERLTG